MLHLSTALLNTYPKKHILDIHKTFDKIHAPKPILIYKNTYQSDIFRQLHSKRPQIILIHLTCVLLLSYLVFVFGIDRTDSYLICVCVTATLHYSWLSVWCWMAVEGHTMNMLLVKGTRMLYLYH